MPDFASALKVRAAEIEKPPLPPRGHYVWEVTKYALDSLESPKGRWDTVDFTMQAVGRDENADDVDEQELANFGGVKPLRRTHRFMFPKGDSDEDKAGFDKTLYYMKQFLTEHLGLDENLSVEELVDASAGQFCVADVKYRPDPNNPDNMYAEIGRTAPVK